MCWDGGQPQGVLPLSVLGVGALAGRKRTLGDPSASV